MAALFAYMAVKCSLDNLSSLLPSQGLEDLRMLEPTMRGIEAMLHDAEQHWNLREESAKLRLKELNDLAYDAEEVVEKYEYEVNRSKVESSLKHAAALQGGASSKRKRQEEKRHDVVAVPNDLAMRARRVTERFTEIKDYSDTFSLSENDGERKFAPDIRSVRQTTSIVYAPRILGREEDKEKVIQLLMPSRSSDGGGSYAAGAGSHMSVLAIVGMGGLGKTTLAQLVYNDKRVCQSFDLRAWVCVSEHFNVENVTRKIITSLTRNTCHHIQHYYALQGALVREVEEKRILLVFDDVWNEQSGYWKELCLPLLASRRCDIIVTTRSKAVASLVQTMPSYNLNWLSPDDSWSLFSQTVFMAQEIPAKFVEIGRSIAEKCKGLPLAIKTLGSALRYVADENKWRDVLESELWDLKQSKDEVLPALELSYKHMPIHLKCCFVSLTLFPKGIYLDENRVILLWKILDLLQCDGNDDKDEIGRLYFNELVRRSLLQNYIDGQRVMHDLIHDLACFLAGEEFFRLEGTKPVEIPREARYMSILSRDKSIPISNASQSLRVITMIESADVENPQVLLLNCDKFRIIYINYIGILAKAIIDSMGHMKLLRHFTLVGYEDAEVPNSALQLFNLRTLDIEAHVLHGIGRLVNLHALPKIHLCKCGGCFLNIMEMRNLNKIRMLFVGGLCNVSIKDANEAHLHHKKNLEVLHLDFIAKKSCQHMERSDGTQAADTVSGVQLLESLRPHHQSLKVLRLENFSFDRYPSWLGSTSFCKLTELVLHNCQSQHCPTLGELPSLKSLKICGMDHVEHIGREFCSLDERVIGGFPSLALLSLYDMYQLQEWSEVKDGDFPCLETLWIWSAFKLWSFPVVPSLNCLNLYDCRSLLTFPASVTLRELSISTCASLNELPVLPSLKVLILFKCPSLVVKHGHFTSLTKLDLHAPFKEETLYGLVNSNLSIECLAVWSDTLLSIHLDPQNLPSLTELMLRGSNLQCCDELGSLSSLKKLNVCGAPQLHLPDSLRNQLEELIDVKSLE
ncbi:hypothetical protein BS78_08G136300 [Paspalum vaginatum]|nr:hypothetical protein BS78_08G136300 [Paspalum vaginatum]